MTWTCPLCGCTIQRSMDGTLADGIDAHYRVVHSGTTPPKEELTWLR